MPMNKDELNEAIKLMNLRPHRAGVSWYGADKMNKAFDDVLKAAKEYQALLPLLEGLAKQYQAGKADIEEHEDNASDARYYMFDACDKLIPEIQKIMESEDE